jgi:2-iminobutanoate/2-iminopropanoate deaminase
LTSLDFVWQRYSGLSHPATKYLFYAWQATSVQHNLGIKMSAVRINPEINVCCFQESANFEKTKSMKKTIHTQNAPAAIGPYSQAVETDGMLFISGQVAIDVKTGQVVEGGITEQTEQVMQNIGAILKEAGYSFSDVVKSTCLLSDMKNFAAMNAVYGKYYPENPPARAAFAVKELPLGVLVEIETIAAKE